VCEAGTREVGSAVTTTEEPADDAGGGATRPVVRVGLLVDPEGAPVEVAQGLDGLLSSQLATRLGEEQSAWEVHVRFLRLPNHELDGGGLLDVAGRRARREGWDIAVCVTDLPLREGREPIVADLDTDRRVAVVSLPAFGGMRLRRRVREVLLQLVSDLLGEEDRQRAPLPGRAPRRRRPGGRIGRGRRPELAERFERRTPEDGGVDIRVVVNRGWARLLVGVVRANRPWRLVLGLRRASAVAAAFSTFWLLSSTVWQLSDALTEPRLVLLALASTAAMVAWLIVGHGLWERRTSGALGAGREAALFNAATVVSLGIGVAIMYVGLFVLVLVAARVVLADPVLGSTLGHPPTLRTYVDLAWLVTSVSTVAGALGSGFESEQSVREAAFGYRQRQRRAQRDDEPDDRDVGWRLTPESE
jgi:hypothetical protein